MRAYLFMGLLAFGAAARAKASEPLPSLDAFLSAAYSFHPSNREARGQIAQRRSEIASAAGALMPRITVDGGYTRNEYEVAVSFPPVVEHAVISPYNQWNGTAVLSVPLLDISAIFSLTASGAGLGATKAQAQAIGLQIESQVTQSYYQLLANRALYEASQKALDVAQVGERLTSARLAGGRASKLELDRARAEVEARRQQQAAVELQLAIGARQLRSATDIVIDPLSQGPNLTLAVAALPHEAPLGDEAVDEVPQVAAAHQQTAVYENQAWAKRLRLIPTFSGSFTERLTNAPGFIPKDHYWAATLSMSWKLDVPLVADMRTADSQLTISRAQEQRARLAARDAIFQAHETIRVSAVRVESARVQAEVSQQAQEVAEERYQAGSLTQLDLLQAQRDAFSAQVAHIQAEADLLNAHAQHTLALGLSLIAPQASAAAPRHQAIPAAVFAPDAKPAR